MEVEFLPLARFIKKWVFSGVLSGVVVAKDARTAATRSNDETSLFVLPLCPFADVSNLHCGFIRLFPKRRVTLVESFSSERFFWKVFRWRLTCPAERLEPW